MAFAEWDSIFSPKVILDNRKEPQTKTIQFNSIQCIQSNSIQFNSIQFIEK